MVLLTAAADTVVKLWNVDGPIGQTARPKSIRNSRPLSQASDRHQDISEPHAEYCLSTQDSDFELCKAQCVSISDKGNMLAIGGVGPKAAIVDLESDDITYIQTSKNMETETKLADIKFLGKDSDALLLANSSEMTVSVWDRKKQRIIEKYEASGPKYPISCMALSTNLKFIATGAEKGGEINLFNREQRTKSEYKLVSKQPIHALDLSPGYRASILAGADDGSLQLFDTSRPGQVPVRAWKSTHDAPIRGVSYSFVERRIAYSSGLDKKICRIDDAMRSGASLFADVGSPLTSIACDSVFGWIAVGSIDGEARVYDSRNPKQPFWNATLEKGKSVGSLSFASSTTAPMGARSIRASVSSSHGSDTLSTSEDKKPSISGITRSASTGSRADSVSRQPKLPLSGVTKRPVPLNTNSAASSSRPPIPTSHVKSPLQHPKPEVLPSSNDKHVPKDMPNESVLQKDRSYMELFSPARDSGSQSFLSRQLKNEKTPEQILKDHLSPGYSPEVKHENDDSKSELSKKANTFETPPPSAGDSIMELFTPKEQKRSGQPASILQSQKAPAFNVLQRLLQPKTPAPAVKETHTELKPQVPENTEKAGPLKNIEPVSVDAPSPFPQPVYNTRVSEIPNVQPKTTSVGLHNSLSADIIRQTVQDSLSPFCQQLRNDMLNLHLDIIRQNNEQVQQLSLLNKVSEEARQLRKEVERLTAENELLRKYIPYSNLMSDRENRDPSFY
ncbi:hypothetical protein H4219_002591 [Mycoemilia scoparia]|uniref:Neural cell expressed, developmentally down-regulated 1 n=1 Tax=Mycoemilia scoparia TaxID=417184 RepID=A0A9W8A6H3_9FUNG|nr:hypothetical protein H4219_002591 [Mycoemilia scoparia]